MTDVLIVPILTPGSVLTWNRVAFINIIFTSGTEETIQAFTFIAIFTIHADSIVVTWATGTFVHFLLAVNSGISWMEEKMNDYIICVVFQQLLNPRQDSSQGWKKNVLFPGKLANFPTICTGGMCFCVQKCTISLQIPKFPSNHQHFPLIWLPNYPFFPTMRNKPFLFTNNLHTFWAPIFCIHPALIF